MHQLEIVRYYYRWCGIDIERSGSFIESKLESDAHDVQNYIDLDHFTGRLVESQLK